MRIDEEGRLIRQNSWDTVNNFRAIVEDFVVPSRREGRVCEVMISAWEALRRSMVVHLTIQEYFETHLDTMHRRCMEALHDYFENGGRSFQDIVTPGQHVLGTGWLSEMVARLDSVKREYENRLAAADEELRIYGRRTTDVYSATYTR